MSVVGAVLAQARRRARLSQNRLAKLLNRPQSFVSKIEAGKRDVTAMEFLWIAVRTGAEPTRLVKQLLRECSFRDLQHPPKRDMNRYNTDDAGDDLDGDEDDGTLGYWQTPPENR